MTLDLAKLRAETLALIDGTTPGPWAISRYAQTHISAVSRLVCSVGGYSANSRGPEVIRDENVANARLIAAAPTLAADTLRLLDEIERLTAENERLQDALTFYTISDNWRIDGPLDGNSGGFTGGPAEAVLKETSHDR